MGVKEKICVVCEESFRTEDGQLKEHQKSHLMDGALKLSTDTQEMVRTECQLCGKRMFIQALRSHTKKNHEMTISDYKERFRVELLEKVYHQCGLCGELILHDNDSVASHLHTHKSHTHRQYNDEFMIRAPDRIQPTRSAQQKNRTPPVQSAPPPKRLPPPEPEPKSPPKKSSPSPPLLPPLRQWLSHEDMHLVCWPHSCAKAEEREERLEANRDDWDGLVAEIVG